MKKIGIKIVSYMLIVCMLLSTNIAMVNAEVIEHVEIVDIEEVIEILDDLLCVEEGVGFEVSDSMLEEMGNFLDDDQIEIMLQGIEWINEMIAAGELECTENGTIYESSDDELVIQGNVDKVTWHWWGIKRFANNTNTNKIVSNMEKVSFANGVKGTGATAIGLLFPVTSLPSGIISLANGVAAIYFHNLAKKIKSTNAGYGVVIEVNWLLVYSVYKQGWR